MYKQAEILTFSGIKSAREKTVEIFTGGQPRAGKTGIVLMTKQEFDKNGIDIVARLMAVSREESLLSIIVKRLVLIYSNE